MVLSLVVVGCLDQTMRYATNPPEGPPEDMELHRRQNYKLPHEVYKNKGTCLVHGICKEQLSYLRTAFPYGFPEDFSSLFAFNEHQTISMTLQAPAVTVLTILGKYGYRTVACTAPHPTTTQVWSWTLNKD